MVQIATYLKSLLASGNSQKDTAELPAASEERSTLSNPSDWHLQYFTGGISSAGVPVNRETALGLSAVWACVRILSETVASLPLELWKKENDGSVFLAVDHPLYNLLNAEPSPRYTSFLFRETSMNHICLDGNSYALIKRRNNARPYELQILDPKQIQIFENEFGEIYYRSLEFNTVFSSLEILHIPCMASANGIKGKSPIAAHRDNLGLGLGAIKYGSGLYKNGAHIPGYLSTDKNLKSETATKIGMQYKAAYGGLDNAGKIPVLWEGMKFYPVSLNPVDADYIATRKFSTEEIARIFNVPPHMIQSLERSTNNNIEHQSLDFVKHSIMPYLKRWEQELGRKLLREDEKGTYFFRFNLDGLLRADAETRAKYLATMIQNGIMSRNEARAKENLNPIKGLDEILVPLNMIEQSAIKSNSNE